MQPPDQMLQLQKQFIIYVDIGEICPEFKIDYECSLQPALCALEKNLKAILSFGSYPFRNAFSHAEQSIYQRICTAERIRQLKHTSKTEAQRNEDAQFIAKKLFREQMDSGYCYPELQDIIFGDLSRQQNEANLTRAVRAVLDQVVSMCWTSFEVLSNDVFRIALNIKPTLIDRIRKSKYLGDHLRGSLVDLILAHEFDIKGRVGDMVSQSYRLDSLDKIKEVLGRILPDSELSRVLDSPELYLLAKRRNLIVHSLGQVDRKHAEVTGDKEVGVALDITADYAVHCIKLVADLGVAYQAVWSTVFPGRSR